MPHTSVQPCSLEEAAHASIPFGSSGAHAAPAVHPMSKYASVLIGLAFLVLTLLYVHFVKLNSDLEYVAVRTLLALAGGYAAVGLLGSLEISHVGLKATSGFAVAVLLYSVNPAKQLTLAEAPAAKKQNLVAIDSVLSRVGGVRAAAPVADSLARSVGFTSYDAFKVLATPEQSKLLSDHSKAYIARLDTKRIMQSKDLVPAQ
jgi:hypothetical protein